MRREDLGFVVSRALAILLLTQVVSWLGGLLPTGNYPKDQLIPLLAVPGFLLGIAWLLWFRADAFAPKSAAAPSDLPESDKLRQVLFACVGFFFLVGGLSVVAGKIVQRLIFKESAGALLDMINNGTGEALVKLVVGGLILLHFGNYLRSEKAHNLKQKVAEVWSVGDPEEMKQG
ncbi:MAG: hypothetical protein ACAH95_07055 [Fimbriimonas sp.]